MGADKFKLLIIGTGNPISTFIFRRLQENDRQGIQQVIVCPPDERMQTLQHAQIIEELHVDGRHWLQTLYCILLCVLHPRVFRILWKSYPLNFAGRVKICLKYIPIASVRKVDAIHIQWISSVQELYWLKQLFPVPIIGSARGSDVTVFPATNAEYKKKITDCLQLADYVHCVSADLAKHCLEFGIPATKVFVNYNGIDIQKFVPGEKALPSADQVLQMVSVGALIPRKGFIYQLLIVKALKNRGVKVRLTVAGKGASYEALLYQAQKLGIAEEIQLLGGVNETRVIELLSEADLFLSASYAEGLANSVMEAAAMGLPVVTFDCEGMQEIIQDGVTGHIVPYGDIEQAADQIAVLARNPEQRIAMGLAARRFIEANFIASTHSEKMYEIYQSICRKKA